MKKSINKVLVFIQVANLICLTLIDMIMKKSINKVLVFIQVANLVCLFLSIALEMYKLIML